MGQRHVHGGEHHRQAPRVEHHPDVAGAGQLGQQLGFLANGGTGSYDARVIAHKIRMNPTDARALLFDAWAEASRRAWNWALSEWERQHRDCVGGQRFKRYSRAGVVPRRRALEPQSGRTEAIGREPVAPADEGSPGGSRRHDGVDVAVGSRPRLPAAAQGSGRRLVRLSPPARDRTENRRLVEPVRGAGAEAERRPAHLLPSGQDIHIADRYIELPWGHRLRLLEAPRFRARVVGSTFSLKAERWSIALTMEFERKRQPPPPDTHAGVSLGARTLATVGARDSRRRRPVAAAASTCGSRRRTKARSTTSRSVTRLASPRVASASSAPISSAPAATISLPQPSHGTPCSSQKAYSRSRPSTQRTAFRESRG